jgi:diacylglycerol kinase (ATP)
MGKRHLLIVNPTSGQGSYERHISLVTSFFTKHNMRLDISPTAYQGQATEIAREAASDDRYDVIIGGGGDGTINEVLSGMVGSSKELAILPWGTGNVFAREMNIPLQTLKACKLIRKGSSLPIDIARCNDRYFFLMFSAGFDAYSIKHTETMRVKRIFGGLSYVLGSLKAFASYSYPEINITMDDGRTDSGSFLLVSNTSRYAMYFTITPDANPVDGMLDVYLFKEAGSWNMIKLSIQVILTMFSANARKKEKLFLKRQSFYRCKSVSVSSREPVITQLDGDLSSELPANLEVVPGAVNVILPKKIRKKYNQIIWKKSLKEDSAET